MLPTEIMRVAARGEQQTVTEWLDMGGGTVDALSAPEDGVTNNLLMAASFGGHVLLVEELLMRNASIDLQNNTCRTALLNAAVDGHEPVLRLLLQHKANPVGPHLGLWIMDY